jgi:uncharacterized membrane protein YhaH (DUF805 family)
MKGTVMGFDPDTNTGAISGYDGKRYDFATVDWHGNRRPRHGDLVDFAPDAQRAAQIYPMQPEYLPPSFGQFLFSLEGRVSRSQLWLRWFLPVIAIHVVLWIAIAIAAAADSSAATGTLIVIWVIFWLVTLWPNIAVMVRRIHDRNKTGWLVLAYWVPSALQTVLIVADASDNAAGTILSLITMAVGLWFFIEFGCMRGTIGANRYGPDPVPPR